jgi:uncharacterized alkaline shock family protein YloU
MSMRGSDASRPAAGNAGKVGSGAANIGAGDARGTVRVAPAVLFELIELAVREVPGVVGLASPRGVERIWPRGVHATEAEAGVSAYEAPGLRVRLRGDRLDADVAIVVEPETGIVELSRAIQEKVGAAAGRMLGMTVTGVNVYVADVSTPPGHER